MGISGREESTSMPVVTPVADRLQLECRERATARERVGSPRGKAPRTRSVIERLEEMPRRVPADPTTERGAHLGAVAPVHPAPHTRVAFLGMDLCDARVVTNRAGVPCKRQRELIGLEPFRVE